MKKNNSFYKQLQKDCEHIAFACGKLLVRYQQKFEVVLLKDEVDSATTADLASEKLAISFIHKKYPTHSIYTEETGNSKRKSDYTWYIDPLDGTKDFVRNIAEYNFLIAVEEQGRIVAGAIQRNGINELYACSLGNGAYRNGNRIKVSAEYNLRKSFIGFHLPIVTSTKECVDKCMNITKLLINESYRIRPGWDDAKLFTHVAFGGFDAHIIPSCLKNGWYDVAPGLLLVEEAGGRVTDWDGKVLRNQDMSHGIVASNGKIHDKLLKILSSL